MRNQMHDIPPCSTRQTLCPIEPSVMQVDATVFLQFDIALFSTFLMLVILRCFQLFRLFDLPTIDLPFLPFYSPNPYQPSLVASNTLSDTPEPLFTSLLYSRGHLHRCRQILTSREEILASWNSAPAPAPATVPPTTLSPPATTGYAASYWSTVCRHGMRNVMDRAWQ